MIKESMKLRLAVGRSKISRAIEADGGTTIHAAHMLPHLGYLLPGILATGIKMIEMSYGNMYLDQNPPSIPVHMGGRYEARKRSHTITASELAKRIAQIRPALPEDVFLATGAPGTMNALNPMRFTDDDAFALAAAGADGLHCHHSSLDELKELIDFGHHNGLLIEAYIYRFVDATDPFSYMGIPASNPNEVADAGRQMEELGVDIVGLMFSADPRYYSQEGATEHLPPDVRERLAALRAAVKGPIAVEGQITPTNAKEIHDLGGNILVLGTVFDMAIEQAIANVIREFRGH